MPFTIVLSHVHAIRASAIIVVLSLLDVVLLVVDFVFSSTSRLEMAADVESLGVIHTFMVYGSRIRRRLTSMLIWVLDWESR